MFLGYQKDKIVFAANTRREVENAFSIYFDRIEETDINYVLYNGEYLTPEELIAKQNQQYKKELIAQLDALDLKCIRALRAIQAGTGTQDDTTRLSELEEQAGDIRQKIQQLGE